MADYIVHKAVEIAKVHKKLRRTLTEYGVAYEAQPKLDGCCGIIDTTAQTAQSRTGEPCKALQPAVRYLSAFFGPGLVLIGEAWWPGKDQFHLISGEFRRHAESERLWFVINDVLTAEEFAQGRSEEAYEFRMARIPTDLGHPLYRVSRRFTAGNYGDPQSLCNNLVAQGGHDGLILRDPTGKWEVGRGTTGEIIKVKRKLSFALRVTEVNTAIGGKTGRTVFKLVVDFGGKPLGVGSGVPHNEADVPKVGDIVEVEAMDYSADGLLREPRYKGVRHDVLEPDTI